MPAYPSLDRPLHPIPLTSRRPWAGHRLEAFGPGTGELWLAGPGSRLADNGLAAGPSLDDIAAQAGVELVGSLGIDRLGRRFPLLVKLIDAADWLSLQVHPSDTVARELYGPAAVGKAEAWLVLDADPGAQLVVGPAPGISDDVLRDAIAAGTLDREGCLERPAVPGDALLIRSGTIHAIGAGAFVYEIEQPSDLTFRISDWGRPPSPERPMHTAEALRAVRPDRTAIPVGAGRRLAGGSLVTRDFRLEVLGSDDAASIGDRAPSGLRCEVVSCLRGVVHAAGDGWQVVLRPWDTIVVPAAISGYRISGDGDWLAAVGSPG